MYIAPRGNIKILHNIPLEPDHVNTFYFATAAAQYSYFTGSGKVKYALSAQSYTRVSKGKIRVQIPCEDMYDCNYLMFQNNLKVDTTTTTKWFYAFIDKIDYINDLVSEISFSVDVMQTWLYGVDYTLKSCFVKREHTVSDSLTGVPELFTDEPVAAGEDGVCFHPSGETDADLTIDFNALSVCILVNRKVVDETTREDGKKINNTYIPMRVITSNFVAHGGEGGNVSPVTIDAMIDAYLDDEIVCVYEYPTVLGNSSTTAAYTGIKTIAKNYNEIAGYAPHNKKLFTYPYNFLLMSNNAGQTAIFKWELFSNSLAATFDIRGVFMSIPEIICYPSNYRGLLNDYDSGVILSNFPQCAWSGDTWKAWWAQHKSGSVAALRANMLSQLSSSIGAGFLTAMPLAATGIGAVAAPAVGVATMLTAQITRQRAAEVNLEGTKEDVQHTPSQTYGQTQTACLNAGAQRYQYNFYRMSVRPERAKIIDDYFTKYGYSCMRNKVPNVIVNRLNWCYTETGDCAISGNLPADDAEQICALYNKGITHWKVDTSKTDDGMGDYSWPLG